MSADLISQVVDPLVPKQIQELTAILQTLDIQMVSSIKNAVQLNESLRGGGSFKEYQQSASQTAAAVDNVTASIKASVTTNAEATKIMQAVNGTVDTNVKLLVQQRTELAIVNAEQKELTKSFAGSAQSMAAMNAKQADLTKQQIVLKNAIAQTNQTINQQVKEDLAASTSLDQLSSRLNQLRISYGRLSDAERQNAERGGVLIAEIKALDTQVKALDETQGKSQRNVGNYAGAIGEYFGKAWSAVRKLAYILPGVGIAGILAFATGPIIEYLSKLDIFKEKLSQIKANTEAFNEVNKNANVEIAKQGDTLGTLYRVATNVNYSMKDRLDAGKELIKQFPKEFDNTTALSIANGDQKKSFDELSISIINNAKARAAKSKIDELAAKLLDADFQKEKIRIANINEKASLKPGQFAAQGRGQASSFIFNSDERAKEAQKLQDENKAILQGQIDFLTKFAGGDLAIAKAIENGDKSKGKKGRTDNSDLEDLKKQAEIFKATAENIQQSEQVRETSLNLLLDRQTKIANLIAKKQLAAGDNAVSVEKLRLDTLAKNQQDYATLEEKIYKDEYDRVHAIIEKNLKEFLELQQKYSDDQLNQLAFGLSTTELALSDKYAHGIMSEEEYQKEKYELVKTYNKLVLEEEIRALQLRIDSNKQAGNDTTSDQKKIDGLRIQQTKDKNDIEQKTNEDAGKKLAEAAKKREADIKQFLKEAPKEAENAIISIIESGFKAKQQAIETQKTAVDTQAQLEIDAENRSLDGSKTKADKIALINAKAAAQKATLDKQARKIAHDEAVFQKEIAEARVIQETAVNITKVFPNPYLIAAAVALGAIETAAILSAPLPAFAKGGRMQNDGPMITGELGPELRIDPTGRISLTDGKPNVSFAKAGTQIISNTETMRILARPEQTQFVGGQQISMQEVERLLSDVARNTGKQQPRPRQEKAAPFQYRWNDYISRNIN